MITVSLAISSDTLRSEALNCIQNEGIQLDFEQKQTVDLDPLLTSLERARPDLVLIDISSLPEPAGHVIERLKGITPGTMIVALDTSASTERVLECFRAGATEYLFPPLAEGLQTAIQKREAQRTRVENNKPRGRLLVFLSAKGGCGATTLACHVAVNLASATQRVLLADLDMQAGMVSFLMKTQSPYSMADALNNTHRLDASYWSALVSQATPGMDVIAAPISLSGRSEMKLDEMRKVLDFAHRHYPWTIIDAGRGMTPNTLTALEAATDACIITTPEFPALQQTREILQRLLTSGYQHERVRLILNRVPNRPAVRPEEVQTMLGIRVYASFADSYSELHDAYCQGELLPPDAPLALQFRRLARKLDGAEQIRPEKRVSPLLAALARMKSRAA